jgi:hypothetical protein
MQVTFDLPDEVVTQLQLFEDKLPQILELGLRELNAIAKRGGVQPFGHENGEASPQREAPIAQEGFSGMAEVLEFLASLPTPEAIITLRPSESLQAQISTLLEKNRTDRRRVEGEKAIAPVLTRGTKEGKRDKIELISPCPGAIATTPLNINKV